MISIKNRTFHHCNFSGIMLFYSVLPGKRLVVYPNRRSLVCSPCVSSKVIIKERVLSEIRIIRCQLNSLFILCFFLINFYEHRAVHYEYTEFSEEIPKKLHQYLTLLKLSEVAKEVILLMALNGHQTFF